MPFSRSILALLLLAFLAPATALAADPGIVAEMEKDQPGAHDFAPAGRYDGAHLLAQTVKAFDELTLPSGPVVSDATRASSPTTRRSPSTGPRLSSPCWSNLTAFRPHR